MTDTLRRWGEGLLADKHTEYLNGSPVEVETIGVELSMIATTKIGINSIDSSTALPGQVLTKNENGDVVWADPSVIPDKELREEYPSLQVSWDRVMEALQEYEMVKKLVQDYD